MEYPSVSINNEMYILILIYSIGQVLDTAPAPGSKVARLPPKSQSMVCVLLMIIIVIKYTNFYSIIYQSIYVYLL